VAPDAEYDVLVADLRALGRTVPRSQPRPALATAVMERVAEMPPPRPVPRPRLLADRAVAALVRWRRCVAVAVVALLVGLAVTPPVRAAVADWFGFAGVLVKDDSSPRPSSAPDPPGAGTGLGLDRAGSMVAFTPLVPAALGPPDGVEVSADRRVLSMSWQD
jgi:hypothetical protein